MSVSSLPPSRGYCFTLILIGHFPSLLSVFSHPIKFFSGLNVLSSRSSALIAVSLPRNVQALSLFRIHPLNSFPFFIALLVCPRAKGIRVYLPALTRAEYCQSHHGYAGVNQRCQDLT